MFPFASVLYLINLICMLDTYMCVELLKTVLQYCLRLYILPVYKFKFDWQ